MHLMIRVSAAFSTAAVLALSFAGIAPVGAHAAIAAIAARTVAACPDTYSADKTTAANDFLTMYSTPAADKLSAWALKLIQLRYKYEDTAVPAGCEAEQANDVKALTTLEDYALLSLGTLLDIKNAATYHNGIDTVMQRILAYAAATPTVPTAVATASALVMCKDAAFTNKVFADSSSLLGQKSDTDPAVIGAAALKILAMQYAYEDTTAPASCEAALQAVTNVLSLAIDQSVLTLAKLGDKANAAIYDAFLSKVVNDRGAQIFTVVSTVLDSTLITPPTAAATASQ